MDGVLGGFGHVSKVDIGESERFLRRVSRQLMIQPMAAKAPCQRYVAASAHCDTHTKALQRGNRLGIFAATGARGSTLSSRAASNVA